MRLSCFQTDTVGSQTAALVTRAGGAVVAVVVAAKVAVAGSRASVAAAVLTATPRNQSRRDCCVCETALRLVIVDGSFSAAERSGDSSVDDRIVRLDVMGVQAKAPKLIGVRHNVTARRLESFMVTGRMISLISLLSSL